MGFPTALLIPSGSSATFSDNFTRGDSTTVGNGWNEQGPWEISSNTLKRASAGAAALDICYRTGNITAGYSECIPLSDQAGPTIRYDIGVIGGYAARPNAGNVDLYRVNPGGGTITVLATSGVSVNLTTDRLRLRGQGTSLRVYKNGTQIISTTDGTYTTGVRGVLSLSNNNQSVDNYREGAA